MAGRRKLKVIAEAEQTYVLSFYVLCFTDRFGCSQVVTDPSCLTGINDANPIDSLATASESHVDASPLSGATAVTEPDLAEAGSPKRLLLQHVDVAKILNTYVVIPSGGLCLSKFGICEQSCKHRSCRAISVPCSTS